LKGNHPSLLLRGTGSERKKNGDGSNRTDDGKESNEGCDVVAELHVL